MPRRSTGYHLGPLVRHLHGPVVSAMPRRSTGYHGSGPGKVAYVGSSPQFPGGALVITMRDSELEGKPFLSPQFPGGALVITCSAWGLQRLLRGPSPQFPGGALVITSRRRTGRSRGFGLRNSQAEHWLSQRPSNSTPIQQPARAFASAHVSLLSGAPKPLIRRPSARSALHRSRRTPAFRPSCTAR